VVWTKKMKGSSEFQVGLQAVGQDNEAWGLNFSDYRREVASPAQVAQASGAV
jgi:hypothetical protein